MFVKIFCFFKLLMIFSIYFTLSIYAGTLLVVLRLILKPFQKLRMDFTKTIKNYWLDLTISIFYFYFPHPIYVAYNKDILKKKKGLIVSNHLTNLDWIIILTVLQDLRMYEELCIVMKYSLSKLPIYGYGMKCFDYIFLKRNWQEDNQILSKGLEKLNKKESFFLLFFPEGTILDSETLAKSQKYGQELNLKINNVLYNPRFSLIPRLKGLNKIYDVLKNDIDGIINTTLFITPYKRFLAENYDYNDILFTLEKKPRFYFVIDDFKSEMNMNWLYNIFHEKEEHLKKIVEIHEDFQKIENLEEFAGIISNLYKKKYNYFDKKMWSDAFYLNLLAFFVICAINTFILKKLLF